MWVLSSRSLISCMVSMSLALYQLFFTFHSFYFYVGNLFKSTIYLEFIKGHDFIFLTWKCTQPSLNSLHTGSLLFCWSCSVKISSYLQGPWTFLHLYLILLPCIWYCWLCWKVLLPQRPYYYSCFLISSPSFLELPLRYYPGLLLFSLDMKSDPTQCS